MKKRISSTRFQISTVMKRRRKPFLGKEEVIDEEEWILREATKYLVFNHGMFLVATGLCKSRMKGEKVWIITVTLRYTTGHEGTIGDLLFDGKNFTFLTPPELRKERARQIAADPERMRKWNEFRASTLPTGKG